MSKVVDVFTGKSQKEAAKRGVKEIAKGREAIEAGTEQARADLFSLFADAQQARQAGLGGALDVFRTTAPQQAGVFQEGNVAAQQALLSGLPQIQRAILGQPVNFSALQQPTRIPFDFQVPAALPTTPEIGPQQEAAPPVVPDLAAILAGRR